MSPKVDRNSNDQVNVALTNMDESMDRPTRSEANVCDSMENEVDFYTHQERESYFTVLSKTNQFCHYTSLRVWHFIVFTNLIMVLDFYLHPDKGAAGGRFIIEKFTGLFYYGAALLIGFYLTFILIWCHLYCLKSNLLIATVTVFLALPYAIVPVYLRITVQMGFMTRLIVFTEQIRVFMKIMVILDESINLKSNNRITFSEAIYFLFAPTLMFQRTYPRLKSISFTRLFAFFFRLCNVGLNIAFFMFYFGFNLLEKIAQDVYKNMFDPLTLFLGIITAFYVVMSSWYLLFHLWLNIWAEMLRFADRLFYQDWWATNDIRRCLRVYNIPVHCFIKKYVFQRISKGLKNSDHAIILVVLISMLFHEYFASMISGICLPFYIALPFAMLIVTQLKPFITSKLIIGYITSFVFLGHTIYYIIVATELQYRDNCKLNEELPKIIDPFLVYTFLGKSCYDDQTG